MVLMWTGNEFQAAGPATVNELSANRVLVLVPLSPRNIIWYWPKGGNGLKLGR